MENLNYDFQNHIHCFSLQSSPLLPAHIAILFTVRINYSRWSCSRFHIIIIIHVHVYIYNNTRQLYNSMAQILYINSKDITTPCILQTLENSKLKMYVHFSLLFHLCQVYNEQVCQEQNQIDCVVHIYLAEIPSLIN